MMLGAKPLFLVGFMGSGKSTLGRKLAKEFAMPHVDLDDYIEKQEGLRISQLFAKLGEVAFRDLEHRRLLELISNPKAPSIVSLGGGTPCYHDNMHLLRARGIVIYLKLTAHELLQRISRNIHSRPLLARYPQAELPQRIASLLAEREPFYSQAHLVVQGNSLSDTSLLRRAIEYMPS